MIKCQHCGRQIPYDANLCPYCGRSIKQFQQKDVLDGEQMPEETENLLDEEVNNLPPSPKNDRNLLFLIIAVLALLLVVGGIYHYTSMQSVEEEEETLARTDTLAADTINLEKPAAKVAYNPKKSQRVVVNGEGVRMRFGPSLKSDFLKDEKGATRSVKKGTELECVGEKGDWYQVVYMGKRYYMSKQYTYLAE